LADSLPNTAPKSRVRFSLRWKITLPFLLLALALGIGFLYLVERLVREGEQERFIRQLASSGQQAVDALVRQEADLLELERLIANTEGVGEAAALGNAEALRDRVLPVVANAKRDVVAIVDLSGNSVLSVRHPPDAPGGQYETLRGEAFYANWPLVDSVLQSRLNDAQGDKRAGVEALIIGGKTVPVLLVAGPLRDASGQAVGAILVGQYLETLVEELQQAAGASVTAYDLATGELLASTLEPQDPTALTLTAQAITAAYAPEKGPEALRVIEVNGLLQEEILTGFTARQGADVLGVLGISLPRITLSGAMRQDLTRVAQFGALSLAMVMLAGVLITAAVTGPLADVVAASQQLASGDLTLHLPEGGGDEIGLMARNLNTLAVHMKSQSSEPTLASSGVALDAGSSGTSGGAPESLQASAALLVIDMASIFQAEQAQGSHGVAGLVHQFLSETLEVIARHTGTVETWDSEQLIASFGLRPKSLPARVGALQAVHSGVALREIADLRNLRLAAEGRAILTVGMGIAIGSIHTVAPGIAGLPGRALSGPALEEARRLKAAARDLPAGGLLITQTTFDRLGTAQAQFSFGRAGRIPVPGTDQGLLIREVLERRTKLVQDESPGWEAGPGSA
jgi:hypothetical protein